MSATQTRSPSATSDQLQPVPQPRLPTEDASAGGKADSFEDVMKHDDGSKGMILSMGPQHPSTHGVLRLLTHLDGEKVRNVRVDIGYLHRSWEKIMESFTYPQIVPHSDRNDYLGCAFNEHLVCLAVEKRLGLEPPPQAEYIRVIMCELQRICSHLIWVGTFGLDLGATTAFLWSFREREKIYDLFELVTGGRMFPQFFRLGGVRNDFPPTFFERLEETLRSVERSLGHFQNLLEGNPIFRSRTQGIARLPADAAIAYGCTGPTLRASGVNFDVRRDDPYGIYDRFEFDVPVETGGDCWARYLCRMREIPESIRIIRQAVEGLPGGEVMAGVPRRFRVPPGESFAHVESPRGALGVYLVSDGTDRPFRIKWRSPCFSNLHALERMAPGLYLADLVAAIGSIDIVLGEVDR